MSKHLAVVPTSNGRWAVVEHRSRWSAFLYDLRYFGVQVALYNAYMRLFHWDKVAWKADEIRPL